MLRRLWVVLALLLAPTLVACSSGSSKSSDPSASPSNAGNWVSLASYPIRFQLPDGWDEFSANDVTQMMTESNPVIDDMTSRLGMTVDQFRQMIGGAELWAFAPHATDGFLANVNVLDGGAQELPSEGTLRLQLRALGAELTSFESTTTSLGDAIRFTYTLSNGQHTLHDAGFGVVTQGHVLVFTFSAVDTTSALENADLAFDSLESTS